MTPPAPPPPISTEVVLVDCGEGRRLERLGSRLVDRPAPAVADFAQRDPSAWVAADLRYDRADGWTGRAGLDPWTVTIDDLTLELRPAERGQVGLFPESVPLWRWASRRAAAQPGLRLLNLFAYTGGLTLAAAAAGANVAHVDASRTAVAWARANAARSGLEGAPIRWLVDDADAFVAREVRRGRRYDAIALDPPTYGHGPGRDAWRIEERLGPLLRGCAALLDDGPGFLLVSAHTPGWDPVRLGAELLEAFSPDRRRTARLESGVLGLDAVSGAYLPAGAYARWRRPAR